jgi:hypothetical protein
MEHLNIGRRFLTLGLLAFAQWNLMFMTHFSSHFEEEQVVVSTPLPQLTVRRAQYSASPELDDSLAKGRDTTILLPKRLITVFGTESSGSTFLATAFGIAAGVKTANDDTPLSFRSADAERNVEIQHISLPTGYGPNADNCKQLKAGAPTSAGTVPVLVPEVCSVFSPTNPWEQLARARSPKKTLPEACREEAGLDDFVVYPRRYFVNVTSHIQWYRDRGVEATAVLMIRDPSISTISKVSSHCPQEKVALEQNEHARQLMREAIDKLDPFSEVILVSYEGIVSLQESYLFGIYRQLGINSTYIPSFKDGNAKYVIGPPRKSEVLQVDAPALRPDTRSVRRLNAAKKHEHA